MADGGIIVTKKVVFKAVDEVTRPVAEMNQRLNNLESKLSSLGMKFSNSASGQQSFKQALNETKASAGEVSNSMEKLSRDVERVNHHEPHIKPKVDATQADEGLDKVKQHADETSKSGKSMTKSFVIGGAILNGLQMAASATWGFAKQGFQAAVAGQQVTARWSNMGMTASQIKATGAAVRDLKENTNMSGEAVGNLVTRFYGMTGSTTRAITLAKGVGSITDQLRLSQGASDAFANGLTRIESSGKVTSQSLGRLEKQAPGLTDALQKASGMSKKSFSDLLASGKMTSDQFNGLLEKASKTYHKNAEGWDSTTQGALHHMQTSWADNWKAMMAPLTESSSSGLGALSKSMSALTPEFTQLGKYIAQVATGFAKWLTPQHVKDLGEIVGSVGRIAITLGKGVWKAVTFPLQIIGKVIDKLAGDKHVDALDEVAKGLEWISKNKGATVVLETIAGIFATSFAYSKLSKIANGLLDIGNGIGLIGKHQLSGNMFKDLGKGLSKAFGGIKTTAAKAGSDAGQSFMVRMSEKFIGKGQSFKGLFTGLSKEAEATGSTSGRVFLSRFGSFASKNVGRVGSTIGGRLATGITLVMAAFDIFKGLREKGNKQATDIGKGFGTLIGGALGMAFGPLGVALGSMLGGAIGGKLGPSVKKAGKGAMSVLNDIFVKHDWSAAWNKMKKGFTDTWKGLSNWWDKMIGKKTSSSSKSSSSKKPSEKQIRSLGGNHYSKADIANIKQMNRAVLTYTNTLKTLKQVIKRNDPTKQLNKMNKGLKTFMKDMEKSEKPMNKIAKTFKTFGKSTKTMSSSIRSLTGKHGLGEFTKDLDKLNKDMKHTNVGEYFDKLAKSIKKSKLAESFKSLDKWLAGLVTNFKHLDKPLRQADKSFTTFEKTISKLANRKTGLSKVDQDIIKLSKDLRKYDFGKTLSRQMAEANKAVGKHGFTKQFTAMMTAIEISLKSFSRAMKRNWGDTWKGLSSSARNGLRRAERTVSNELNDIKNDGRHFESSFKSSWSDWLGDLVSAFRDSFGKLPGISEKAMSDIVSRLNRGISGINKVIGDFGGDKKLGTISYAHGTFSHPGGKALINDGLTPYKQELVWQPSKGWGVDQQQNAVRDLEAGAIVIDAQHSRGTLNRFGGLIPHYADGTLSDDEMDKLAEEFENNPVSASKELMLKMTNWNSSTPLIPSFGKATAIGFSRGIANVLKDLLGEVKEPVNGDWTPVIRSAAAKMHVHLAGWQIKKLLRQIQTESGGIETRRQEVWDQNMASGNPAMGLLQFVPSTFYHWALPGHRNIMSGFDQIMAAINCLDQGGEGGWGNIGNGHGWASGVHMTHKDLAWIGDNAQHDEYVINPYAASALPLMRDAMDTMTMAHPEWQNSASTSGQSTGQVVAWLKEVVKAVNNIDLQPVLPVDETRRMINKQNAADVRLMS